MSYKLVTREVVKTIYQVERELRMDELINRLKEMGYCASERALVDIGVYPTYVRGSDGHQKIYARMS